MSHHHLRFMRPLRLSPILGFVVGGLLFGAGCGEGLDGGSGDSAVQGAQSAPGDSESALNIHPRVELIGLSDIYSDFELTHLDFTARLYLLPSDGSAAGVSAEMDVEFDGDRVYTHLNAEHLTLAQGGTYDVLLGIYPSDGRASVIIGGNLDLPVDDITESRGKGDDAEQQDNFEPVPMPARNPADDPGAESGEPASEPVPMPARNGDPSSEPVPMPARDGDPSSEPVPMPARDGDNRGKGELPGERDLEGEEVLDPTDDRGNALGEPVFVQSRRIFEFRVGQISLDEDTRELLVTWDVSEWLGALVADAFGEPVETSSSDEPEAGFSDTQQTFQLSSKE